MEKLGGRLPFPILPKTSAPLKGKSLKGKVSLASAKESFELNKLDYDQTMKRLKQLRGHARNISRELKGSIIQQIASQLGLGGGKKSKLKWINREIEKEEGKLIVLSKQRTQIEKVIKQSAKIATDIIRPLGQDQSMKKAA